MSRQHIIVTASVALAIASFVACSDPGSTSVASGTTASLDRAGFDQAGAHRQYGTPQRVGNGTVRTYIVSDQKEGGRPLEVGVAMSERALEGLPAPVESTDPMANMHMYILDLPAQNRTQYKFVQFDWNPKGHEPDSVYTVPHFDFHFYTIPVEVKNSIVPSDPRYLAKAASYPADQYRYPFYLDAATAGRVRADSATVPMMGLHWLDVRSPELQKLTGHPEAWQPFTKTFLYGSWDGQFIFDEPMITRDYILSKKTATDPAVVDELIPVPTAQRYNPAGYYPNAYRITWDAQAKEYRIAVTQLAWRS